MSVVDILRGLYFVLLGAFSTSPSTDFSFAEYDKIYHLTNTLQCQIVNATDKFHMNYTSRIQANVRRIITPLEDCPQNICNDTAINRIIKHKDSLGAYRDTLENITLAYTSTRIPVADSLQALNAVIRHLKTILRRAGASSTTYTPSPLSTTQSTVIQYVSEYGFSKLTDLWLRDAILYEFFMSLLRYQNEINIDVIQFSGCRQSYQCGCSVLELCRLNYQSCI